MSKDPLSKETTPSRSQAEEIAKALGCSGAHRVGNEWAPCNSHEELMVLIRRGAQGYREWRTRRGLSAKRTVAPATLKRKPSRAGLARTLNRGPRPKKGDWEKLGEKPNRGIETMPGGGLVNAKSRIGFDLSFLKSLHVR